MYIILLIVFIFAAITAALFFEPLRISFFLDSDKLDMHALVRWLSFIGIEVRIIDYRLFITVRLFSKKFAALFIKKGKHDKSKYALFESLSLSDTRVKMAYGFNEPYLTGIFCAAADFAGVLISNVGLELEPDFFPDREFLRIKAATSLNLGKTIINLAKAKFRKAKRRKSYG